MYALLDFQKILEEIEIYKTGVKFALEEGSCFFFQGVPYEDRLHEDKEDSWKAWVHEMHEVQNHLVVVEVH